MEADNHYYQLVTAADAWRWSSLWRREHGTAEERKLLSSWPLPRLRGGLDFVNEPQTDAESKAIRQAISRGQPFGKDNWIHQTAKKIGLEYTMRRRGRPNKVEPAIRN